MKKRGTIMMTEEELKKRMSQIRLLVIDLDCTTLDEHRKCTPRTARDLQELIDRGLSVVPATGRMFARLVGPGCVLPLEGVRYAVTSDGACLTQTATGRRIWQELIPGDVVKRLCDEVIVPGAGTSFHWTGKNYARIIACGSRADFEELYGNDRIVPEPVILLPKERDEYLSSCPGVPKLGLKFRPSVGFSYYEEMAKREYPELNCFQADTYALEYTSVKTDKAVAVGKLAKILGVVPSEICAVGDNGNDAALLSYAGVGVCMGNGTEAAKRCADVIIGTNAAEGLAAFLEEYLL